MSNIIFEHKGVKYTNDDLVEILNIRCIDNPLDDYTIIKADRKKYPPIHYGFTIFIDYKDDICYFDILEEHVLFFTREKNITSILEAL